MIGSHDSYTYLKSTNSLMNTISDFWRCQNKTILELYEAGVRFFDVRVTLENKNGTTQWRVCHGMSNLDKTFLTLRSICAYFQHTLIGSKFRLILEKGDSKLFEDEVALLIGMYSSLIEVCIKNPWKTIYCAKDHPKYICYYYEPWNTGKDLSTWDKILKFIKTISTIKKYSKKHNPKITKDMIDDDKIIYLMDYVTDNL